MTMEEVIRMAREAGLVLNVSGGTGPLWLAIDDDLERFAARVAAAEREACARVADHQDGDDEYDPERCIWSKAARHIAAAIRARGQA